MPVGLEPAERGGGLVVEGRSRTVRLVSGSLSSLIGRGSAALMSFLLVPVTLGYLGPDVFGLWMAVAALSSMTLWADLGLGNSLLTQLSPLITRRAWSEARTLVSTSYAMLGVTGAVLLVVLWGAAPAIPWAQALSVADPGVAGSARLVGLLGLTAVLVNVPASLVHRVLYAQQQIWQSNAWQLASSVTAVLAAWAAVRTHCPPVLVIGCALSAPVLVNLLCTFWCFGRREARLAPRPAHVTRAACGQLLRTGPLFVVISTATAVAFNADNLLVAHVLDLAAVTALSVPAKVFLFLGVLVGVVNIPLWPLNADALARGDLGWVRRTTRRMTLLSAGTVLAAAVVAVTLGGLVLTRWVGPGFGRDHTLLIGLGLWWVVVSAVSPRFMVQNAQGVLLPQLVGALTFLALSMPVKVWVLHTYGLSWLPYAGAGCYALAVLPAAEVGYRRAMRQAGLAAGGVTPGRGTSRLAGGARDAPALPRGRRSRPR